MLLNVQYFLVASEEQINRPNTTNYHTKEAHFDITRILSVNGKGQTVIKKNFDSITKNPGRRLKDIDRNKQIEVIHARSCIDCEKLFLREVIQIW